MTQDTIRWENIGKEAQGRILQAIDKAAKMPDAKYAPDAKRRVAKEACADIDKQILSALGFSVPEASDHPQKASESSTAVLHALRTLAETPHTPQTGAHALHAQAKTVRENFVSLKQEAIDAAIAQNPEIDRDLIGGCDKAFNKHFPEGQSGKVWGR